MFMMTTRVEGSNDHPTKDRHFNFRSRKIVDYNQPIDFFNPNFKEDNFSNNYVPTNPNRENLNKLSLPTDKAYIGNHHDEGYNTDSKSNTSPSTTSPLSSSFSSMSTFDGSFNSPTSPSGGISPNSYNSNHFAMHGNTQRGPVPQKLSLIQGNGKIHVNRHALIMAKKKDSPQEMPDSSSVNLEDRLRALTTIEEEEPGISNVLSRETYKKQVYSSPETEDHSLRHNQPTVNGGNREERVINSEQGQTSGFFRAVPVEIAAPHYSSHQMSRVDHQNDHVIDFRSVNHEDARQTSHTFDQNSHDKNWHDYRRYFEKDCEIPLHNIDALNRGKFVNAGLDNANDKDINRQLRTNSTDVRSGQLHPNLFSNGQHRNREEHRLRNENFGNGSLPEDSPRSQAHGYPPNSQRIEERGSDCNFYPHTQPSTQRNNPENYHRFQQEQSVSLSNPPFHNQGPQFDSQPPHINQYPPQHPYLDSSFLNSHNGPTGSYNSLPRRREDQHQHSSIYSGDVNQFSENDVPLRRSWASSSTRAIPDRIDRYSWHPESRSKQPTPTSIDRYSLDLGNIPQLQQQIRATSEMCLQASTRHKFASSADIYKLFQGQKKPSAPSVSASLSTSIKDFSRGQSQSHRHSFHALPGGSWASSQPNIYDQTHHTRDSTLVGQRQHGLFSHNTPKNPSPSPGPLRGDHSISIPQTTWANNSFHQSNSSASNFPLTVSETPHIQRQSSGYSSENELQQIEQNAKAAKKTKNRNTPHFQQEVGNADQEFVPVDPTRDHDSSSSIIENEPVYVNQPMLGIQREHDSLSKSSPTQQQSQFSTSPPPPLPARPHHLQPTQVSSFNGDDLNTRIGVQTGSSSEKMQQIDPSIESHNASNKYNPRLSPAVITQNQIINFNQKPMTINSYVPNYPFNSHPTNTNSIRDAGQPISPGEEFPSRHSLDFQTDQEQYAIEQEADGVNHTKRSNSYRSNRTNSSPCHPLSPLEIAQVLDVPFATNVISDECGDRLSTLV